MDQRLISFTCGDKTFAVPMDSVIEVVHGGRVWSVPLSRPVLEGVMAYREGEVLSILSLPGALGWSARPSGDLFLVVRCAGETFGMRVERIGDIIPRPGESTLETPTEEPPSILGRFAHKGKMVSLLDLEEGFASVLR